MDDMTLQKIMAAYGFPNTQLLSIQKGYRNSSHHIITADDEHLNLIMYKDEPDILARIKRTNTTADYVAAAGIPARRTADPRIMQLRAGGRTRYAALYTYLPGETIS